MAKDAGLLNISIVGRLCIFIGKYCMLSVWISQLLGMKNSTSSSSFVEHNRDVEFR